MKGLISLFLLGLPAGAIACPPTPPETPERVAQAKQRLENFKNQTRQAHAIVYGIMVESLGYDRRRRDSQKTGVLRVIHSYQGPYRPGQRIRMRPGYTPLSNCPMPPTSAPEGSYGVVILDRTRPGKPIAHNGFLPREWIDQFIAEGIIVSAQAGQRRPR